MAEPRSRQLLRLVAITAVAALSISDPTTAASSLTTTEDERAHEVTSFELTALSARYTLLAEKGQLVVASTNGRTRYEIDLSISVDGIERAISPRGSEVVRTTANLDSDGGRPSATSSIVAPFRLSVGAGANKQTINANLELALDSTTGILRANVVVPTLAREHTLALRLSTSPGQAAVFVPDHGELGDFGEVQTRSVVVDDDLHPFGVAAANGDAFSVMQTGASELEAQAAMKKEVKPRLTTIVNFVADGDTHRADAALLLGDSSDVFWGALYGVLGVPVAHVTGTIARVTGRAHIYALDEGGHPLLRVPTTSSGGRFVVDAPLEAVRWYGTLDASIHTRTAVVRYQPKAIAPEGAEPPPLALEMLPGGELSIRVLDADTGLPVLARLVVRGVDGAVDPVFTGHPDFRASGVGPLVDVRSGELKTILAPGRYRVSALKGIEWSIDSEIVEMESGTGSTVELHPRHVVATPGLVGCDLHVHARPSFDTSVSPEDRLLTLASAGIDFAVPTEHNMVGDYTMGVEHMDLKRDIAHVGGVEVTTVAPAIGHFGVFPYPKNAPVPPHTHSNINAIFSASRKDDPSRVLVVHHPRLPLGLGYFQINSFDSRSTKIPSAMRTDFDLVEVYSGTEILARAKTEATLKDWFALLNLSGKRYAATGSSDSHKIQFQWAGYPRTYVRVPPDKAGDTGAPIDPMAVVAAVKKGQGFITSGPIIELTVDGAQPGQEIIIPPSSDRKVRAHLRVRAAPWIDVSKIEIVAGGTSIYETTELTNKRDIPIIGKEHGTLEEANARTIRFDSDLDLTLPSNAKWLVALARGDRSYADVLPFMPVQPMGFTNPIWVR